MPAYKHKNRQVKQQKHIQPKQQLQSSIEQLYQLLDNGDIEMAYQIVSPNINMTQSVEFLDIASEICQMNNDLINAQRALQIAVSKSSEYQNLPRYMQLFGLDGDPHNLGHVLNYYSKNLPTKNEDIERFVFANAYLSQHFIQVQPDEAKALHYATEAAKYKTLVGLIQLAGAYVVLQRLEEAGQASVEALKLMQEQGMFVEKESDEGIYLEPQPNALTPETQFLLNFCRVLTALERLDEAELVADLAREIAPEDPVVLHELAWIANLQDRYEDAAELLQKAKFFYMEAGYPETDELIIDINSKLAALTTGQQGNQ